MHGPPDEAVREIRARQGEDGLARLIERLSVVPVLTAHPTEARRRVIVECLRMGGAFGGKEVQANAWAAVAALGTRATGRPVRVRLPRVLDMAITGKRHPFLARYRAGFEQDGRIQALQVEYFADGGWSLDLSEPIMWRALFHADNAYSVPALDVTGRVCRTHKTSQTAFRGFGGPQGMLVMEEILDRVARRLELVPELVRERNLYRGKGETNTTHYGQEIEDNRIQAIWHALKESAHVQRRRAELAEWNAAEKESPTIWKT